jgi:hypothetical protein
MNAGVEILIQRLKDCPEDFGYDVSTDRSSKWNTLLMDALNHDFITEEEKLTLRHEITEMNRNKFTEKVMKALVGVEDETSGEEKSSIEAMLKNATFSSGQTLASSSGNNLTWSTIGGTGASTVIQLGNEVLDEHILRKIKRKLGL